jgi:CBS domain-containing protein
MKIADILDTKGRTVHSVLPWLTVAEVVERLDQLSIGAVLVCDANGRMQGIVSERDIVRALGKHGTALLDMPVSEVMTHYGSWAWSASATLSSTASARWSWRRGCSATR